MFKKKFGIYALTLAMAAMGITGCSSSGSSSSSESSSSSTVEVTTQAENKASSEPFSVVCTIFPEYDWVKEILGDHAENVELTYLLDNGVDLHSYQPTADDMMKISTCDLFVYVGGESDEWVEDALADATNKDMKVINLMDVLGDSAKVEELKEGMQESEHEHDHDHSKEVSTFEDDEVQDRPLSDWEGDWQSAYPLVLDGSLDEAWEHKAESGKMTAEEYKEYYTKGYKSDYSAISIHDDHITFTDNDGKVTESDYKYTGYFIQDWSTGTRAAMYRFEAEDKESGAPVYIEFNDHMIEPEKAEHFHIRMSNESYDAIVDPEGNWPTFFDASLSPEGVCEEVIGHDSKKEDDHDHEHEKKEVTEDRTLSDYEGEWQSLYPFMNEKFKEETVSYMAEAEGFDDEDEAWDFFYKGNETDVRYVNIKGDNIEFIKEDGSKTSGTYEYDGFYSDCWGETSIRYQFKNTDNASSAPKYVQFDDHLNYPTKAEHFHIYCGDDGKAMLDIKYNWPTYYPADIEDEDDMIHEFLKHYITDEDEDEEEHEHEHEEGEEEYDEHVWLSLKNAKVLCAEIEKNIEAIDPANASDYKANLDSYVAKLSELDNSFQTLVDGSSVKTLVFGDRFPFRYFVDDYGLDYFAAFIGCSAETEASFETIAFLADKVKELDCKTIFTLENSSKDIANTIINTSGKSVDIAELNSLQSVSKDDISDGASYISLMQKNYDVLAGVLK